MRDVKSAKHRVETEVWFMTAMSEYLKDQLRADPRFKDAPQHVINHYARAFVTDPRERHEKEYREEARKAVMAVLYSFRRSGIVPVPLDS